MSSFTRRRFALAGMAGLGLSACGNGINSRGSQTIDARVEATLYQLYDKYPATRDLAGKSTGILVMPLVTEAGFGIGAGALGHGRNGSLWWNTLAGRRSSPSSATSVTTGSEPPTVARDKRLMVGS